MADAHDEKDAPTEPATPPNDDEWDEEESILTWKLLLGIVVALVVVAVLAMTLFGSSSDNGNVASGDTDTTVDNLANVPAIRDDFTRPDNSSTLGKASTGEDWDAALGTWGISSNQAYVAQKNTGPRNIALVDLGQGDGSVGATASKMVNGWGLAFRYRGPNAYWYIASTPLGDKQTAGFNVFKVTDGVPENVKANCIKQLQDDSKVRVEFSGALITVFVDDKPVCTVNDNYLQAQTKVGLFVAEQGVADARWSSFVATKGLAGPPVTAKPFTPPTSAGGGSSTTAPAPSAPSTTAAPQG